MSYHCTPEMIYIECDFCGRPSKKENRDLEPFSQRFLDQCRKWELGNKYEDIHICKTCRKDAKIKRFVEKFS